MKLGYGILIAGVCMIIVGHFVSQWIINNIPTINPSHLSTMADAQYNMLDWSNQLITISQWGLVVLVIGGFVTILDRMKKPKSKI
ncbi:MAG: hypothetical protein ACREBB_06075 [Nitrosotalea sp.]